MINKYFYNLSVTITGIITAIFILTTVGGLFHIPVNPLYVFIPFIGGLYYLKKQSAENIDFLKQFLILLLIIMFSYIISISIWDVSWDGRWYHIASSIMYKNGWLPIYDNYENFADLHNIYHLSAFWANCYVNFVELVGGNIYKLTGLLESTKSINFITWFSVFMYSFFVLNEFNIKNKIFPFVISLIIVLNPVCIYQVFTNYIDLHIFLSFTLLLFTIINVELKQNASKTDLFMFICSSIMLSMTKFTGLVYLFIIYFIYFFFLILKKRKIKKFIITLSIFGLLAAITGIHPYYTNYRDYNNPFYPFVGKDKKIIVDKTSTPRQFIGKNNFEKFIISNISESVNSIERPIVGKMDVEIIPKIPFTKKFTSVHNYFYTADMRIGGFGYYWSGIICLMFILVFGITFRNSKEKQIFIFLILAIIVSSSINPYCWWARYVPQLWLIPVLVLFFGFIQCKYKLAFFRIIHYAVIYISILFFIYNSGIIINQNWKMNIKLSNFEKQKYSKIIKMSPKGVYLMKKPEDKLYIANESIIPHLKESVKNILYVKYDENKIISEGYIPIQNFIIYRNYFVKPIQ